MGDKNKFTLFMYKKHHGHPQNGFGLFLTQQASSKTTKIHPSGDHVASYRQSGWGVVYVISASSSHMSTSSASDRK